ncbi:MAG: hypothetical protein JXR41_01125 [Bacteroidales bacterium]|nr:hypothetical protein [Bacteroidales bacterium]MBN2761661.1 hypothetical protein [Bacteroidales bacterium]
MKTIILSLALAAVCFTARAGKNSLQYVITKGDTLICANLRFGVANTKCKLTTGEKMVIPNEDIVVIGKKSSYKERKPVYLDNTLTGKDALMELIDCDHNMRIFKYEYFNNSTDRLDVIISVYKDGKCINTLKNVDIGQVYDFIDHYTDKDYELANTGNPGSE